MIRFDTLPPEVMQAMCTPMHAILPPSPSPSPSSPSSHPARGALYLGSLSALQDPPLLRHHGITHLVQVLDVPWLPLSERDGFKCYKIPIQDDVAAGGEMVRYLGEVCEWIERALREGGNVLVHCQQGISRSPAITIAYLMLHHHMSYSTAHAHVLRRRACIKPNSGFVRALMEWEGVIAGGGGGGGGGGGRPGMGGRRFTT